MVDALVSNWNAWVWTTTDRIAIGALFVAFLSLTVACVPAIMAISQARTARQSLREKRRDTEPAVNAYLFTPADWPRDHVGLDLSVKNWSHVFIEVRQVRIRSPRGISLCYLGCNTMREEATSDLTRLTYARWAEIDDMPIKCAGSTGDWPDKGHPDDEKSFYFAVFASKRLKRIVRLELSVEIAPVNRRLEPITVLVQLDIPPSRWMAATESHL